jgi:hypothetical protein
MQVLYQLSYAPATDRRPFVPHHAGALHTGGVTKFTIGPEGGAGWLLLPESWC